MKRKSLFAIFFLTLLFVCAGMACAKTSVSSQRQKLIDYSMKLRGCPYKYGGRTKAGFDCSGFVSYAVKEALGIKLTPQTSQMYVNMTHIKESEREPGDLMFFAVKGNDGILRINHVSIYLGVYNGSGKFHGKRLMIHAASDGPQTGVIVSSIDERYWKNHFYGYARFLPATKESKAGKETKAASN